MKSIKILTAPYKFYNQYMPPVALGLISQTLLNNNIKHSKDDLYVKLHHAQKNNEISISSDPIIIKQWDSYILGNIEPFIERKIEQIANLSTFKKNEILIFTAISPPKSEIPNYLIPLALFRYFKKKYNSYIITNNPELKKGEKLDLIDNLLYDIPSLLNLLKDKFKFKISNINKISTTQNLDELPIQLYSYQGITVAGYYFFDGCPHNCTFCDRFFINKKDENNEKLYFPKNIIPKIKEFSQKYNITNFMFMNTTINPSTKISSEFAKQLINSKINIKWCDCANFKNMTTELLDLLKESGCVKLVFGFETASKFLQEKINKKISLSHAEKIIKHSYKIGIWIDITLLCGLPYETYEDLYLTLCFIKKNYKYLRGINLNRFIMKMNDYYFHQEKYKLKIFKINNNPYTTLGFDELEGNKWKNKWQFTEDVYQEIIKSLDPIRVNYLRPVNQIFRIFSNDISINRLNDYIDNKILNQNTSKLDLLIKKYKNLSNK